MAKLLMLLYTSVSNGAHDRKTVSDILTLSRRNNDRDEITGFLIERKGRFMQMLEGPEANVRACFERIRKDARHKDVIVVGEAEIPERSVGSWSMALVEPAIGVKSGDAVLELFDIGGRTRFTDSNSLRTIIKMFAHNATPVE